MARVGAGISAATDDRTASRGAGDLSSKGRKAEHKRSDGTTFAEYDCCARLDRRWSWSLSGVSLETVVGFADWACPVKHRIG